MKILVINTGSSSIKYQLFDMEHEKALAIGIAEKIGEVTGRLTHKVPVDDGMPRKRVMDGPIKDHREGMNRISALLVDQVLGVIRDKSEIAAVGHRVVHGGEAFQAPTIINEAVIAEIKKNTPLAPLHNPPNLVGIEVARAIFPGIPQVAVFDTAFHHTMPRHAYLYALPYDLYQKEGVRRYGFHGTSHAYVSERAAEHLGKGLDSLNMITIHLGNGASIAAIEKGRCIDTSMGMTPLEGLVMGTRAGDLDPALPFFLSRHLKMNLDQIDGLLNKQSGLKGICGTNDMREVLERRKSGDDRAEAALDIYTYRIKKYIGAYIAVLGIVDAIVFTGGIGENAPIVRELSCHGLTGFGISIDREKNNAVSYDIREISAADSNIKVLVVPTNEELKIAQETKKVVTF
ncbi:acetate kinase A and propionate kinase 2 [uncultured Desulfobacterium sp.]|uniref:Acetate kinase n=1 Tax=uncultured Desulfobacterium sp. TaxID=201089 RepID=A0A445MRR9_9BACT|nr:acetate kinase A and propionate kinase 2 [uncultured Desulfobacterium sp.]